MQPETTSRTGTAHEVFKHKSFVRFQLAKFLGVIAMQMQSVAVGWQVYAMSNRPLNLGFVGLSIFLPYVLFALFAGDVADRFDRRKILVFCYSAFALCSSALLYIAQSGSTAVDPIYGVLTLIGATRAFTNPAASAILPQLVPSSIFGRAVAWSSSIFEVATISGPALGGILYGVGGATMVYGACVVLMLTCLGLLASLDLKPHVPSASTLKTLARVLAGLQFIWKKKLVLGAISLDLFAVLFGGAVALLPIFAKDILHVGPLGFGMMRSAPAVGALVMAVYLAYFPLQNAVGIKMFVAVLIFGVATCVFGLSENFVLSVLALAVVGASDMVSVVIRQTLIQLGTPDEMRGRVSAVNSLFIGASNELGEFESGVTAEYLGTVRAAVLGGICTCVVVVLWSRFFPSLRNADRFEAEDPAVKG